MECLRTNKHEMKNIKMGADEEWTLCDKKEVLELDISYPIEKIHAQTFGIKISTGKNTQREMAAEKINFAGRIPKIRKSNQKSE